MELTFYNCKSIIPRQCARMEVGAGATRSSSPAWESQRRPYRASKVCTRTGRGSRCLFVKTRKEGHSRQREQHVKGKGHGRVLCVPGSACFLCMENKVNLRGGGFIYHSQEFLCSQVTKFWLVAINESGM